MLWCSRFHLALRSIPHVGGSRRCAAVCHDPSSGLSKSPDLRHYSEPRRRYLWRHISALRRLMDVMNSEVRAFGLVETRTLALRVCVAFVSESAAVVSFASVSPVVRESAELCLDTASSPFHPVQVRPVRPFKRLTLFLWCSLHRFGLRWHLSRSGFFLWSSAKFKIHLPAD